MGASHFGQSSPWLPHHNRRLMPGGSRIRERMTGWTLCGSIVLHILLCTLISVLPPATPLEGPRERSIEVEIVTLPPEVRHEPSVQISRPAPTEFKPPDMIESPDGIPTSRKKDQPQPRSSIVVKPSRMLTATVLADPRSRQTLKALSRFMPDERIEQLCGIEAMAQVSAWNADLQADRVVAYAMSNPKISGDLFLADGAAFHSKREWYRIKFKCVLTPDHSTVSAFEFIIGDSIPKRDWEKHSLPDEAEPLD